MRIAASFRFEDGEVDIKFNDMADVDFILATAEGIEYALRRLITTEAQWNELHHYAEMYLGNEDSGDHYRKEAEMILNTKWEGTPFLLNDDMYKFYQTVNPF